jgi:hypothetical protein
VALSHRYNSEGGLLQAGSYFLIASFQKAVMLVKLSAPHLSWSCRRLVIEA